MTAPTRATALALALAMILPVACSAQPSEPIAKPANAAAPLVTGLPDFTRLVQQVSPAVVSINAEITARPAQQMPNQEVPEIFRRFFGDQLPPGMFGNAPESRDRMPSARGVSMGTGFFVSRDGYLLTNAHVVNGAGKVTVKLADRRELPAKVVGADERSDVALLKVEGNDLPFLQLADSAGVKAGQWVVAIGSPFGLEQSVTAGVVSAVGRNTQFAENQYVPFIQTDVAINRGNSGGPLLNVAGQVVGINSQIFSNSGGYMGVSFAIPIDVAMNAAEQLRSTGRVARGQLGVRIQPLDADQLAALKLSKAQGALVADVEPGSAGAKAGLLPLDVITAVNGQQVGDAAALPAIIGGMRPGAQVRLDIIRDGKPRQLNATLSELVSPGERTGATNGATGSKGATAPSSGNRLGVIADDLPAGFRERNGIPSNQGVGVVRVLGQSAADAGLSGGDIVLMVGRENVASVAALNKALAVYGKGETVMVRVLSPRAGSRFVAITLD